MSVRGLLVALLVACAPAAEPAKAPVETVALPAPTELPVQLDQAITARRSVRSFTNQPLAMDAVTQLLASVAARTGEHPHQRALPSAGGLHPLEFYLVVGAVEGLEPGVYRYIAEDTALQLVAAGDRRQDLMGAALGQGVVGAAPACLVIAAEYERTTGKYGRRGHRYVHMEVGHAAQNIYLTATALGLGTVSVGAFEDERAKRLLETPYEPLLIMPLGHPS